MKIKNILVSALLLVGMGACSVEAPFTKDVEKGEGKILSSALSVQLRTDENLVRSGDDTSIPSLKDFIVDFISLENAEEPVKSYKYGEMPDVVTLPVGDYIAKAYYGGSYGSDGQTAAFNAPYYKGESSSFTVEQDKITDNIGSVVCTLSNIKVSIFFDENLLAMSENAQVSVEVGNSNALTFTAETEESGFFAYEEGVQTITARFSGIVEEEEVHESKSYNNVKPGNHYKITFKLHKVDPNVPGDIVADGEEGEEVKVDANIQLVDMTGDGGVDVGASEEDDIYMEDDRYINGNDDNTGNDDTVDDTEGPVIIPSKGIKLDDWNVNPESCELTIKSKTGITGFTVDIKSDKLTPEELDDVGLSDHLDLINPGKLKEGLEGLGLLQKGESIEGKKEVTFSITGFMPMLKALDSGDHIFVLKVTDTSGSVEKELKIRITAE